MLFRRPSSLPISASVVAVKPLRAKHLAAADKIDATRGFSQSAARCDEPFSSGGLRGLLTTGSVWFMFFQCTGQPASVGYDGIETVHRPLRVGGLRAGLGLSQVGGAGQGQPLALFPFRFRGLESRSG